MLTLELQPAQIAALNRFGFSIIKWKVICYVDTYKITGVNSQGQWQYDNTEIERSTIDLTNHIRNVDIVLNAQIPYIPTTDGKDTTASNISLQIDNVRNILGAVGAGTIINIDNLYNSKVEIYLNFGEGVPDLAYYFGEIIQIEESKGSTILEIRDSSYTIFKRANLFAPARWAIYYRALSGAIVNNPITFTPSFAFPFRNYIIYHGLCRFDADGNLETTVQGIDTTIFDVRIINFTYPPFSSDAPLLGQYTIEFETSTRFRVSTPNSQEYLGDIAVNFAQGNLSIPSNSWIIIDSAAMPGQKFTFYNSYVVSGNPISIVRDLIFRAYSNDWVQPNPVYGFAGVDWDGLLYYEMLFKNTKVYITETNKDNNVFLPLSSASDNRLTCKRIIAKILSHVGCQITFDNQGRVSINTTWYSDGRKLIWQLGSIHSGGTTQKDSHSTSVGKPIRFLRVLYGYDILNTNRNFLAQKLQGQVIVNDKDRQEVVEIGFEYFKKGLSKVLIDSKIAPLLWNVTKFQHIKLSAEILPNFGVGLMCGDKFIADFSEGVVLPNLEKEIQYFQIINVSKGKRGAKIECIAIPKPVKVDYLCDNFIWCKSLWT